ncbi:GNAT family N-acetyltransferase [Clostridium swellfunianum]|uniref:GNAT family N-acetyltransferase n=1 Tax=Clostridium swellfunianum TaxID=1367462 RepID=UPI002030A39C|nr:GNAT family N-acetyltransferase [Clostridium swellfunianum]MCM0648969.1 GNAT family N-acetyltransferase [Clostridium swellfunianum]
MFDMNVNIDDDIYIRSVKKEDVVSIQKWINNQNYNLNDKEKPLGLKEIYERFLEYYVSEGEFFLKINKGDALIGILKGRIEFKNPNEVWIWYFLIDKECRNKGIGSKIVEGVENYFNQGFGIYDFYCGVCEQDTKFLRFWNKNGYRLMRISKGFFKVDEQYKDMMIFKKEL